MSAVTIFKQSVSHVKERKPQHPSLASTWATPRPVLIYTAYVCLVTLSTLGVGLSLRPWNISCSNARLPLSPHTAVRSRLSALAITTLDLPTLLAASGVHPSRQPAILYLTYLFLRKTGQLPHL
ncbi:hypothetical protein E2C01_070955 [Portunus trituberculatus]|uniref:Uncharacterized protein n=1 Tax=Portunus trituberculatus TaxID=210409 RepID=A0A5B7I6Q5_PORTR|nr:hypothetical protein [Portunus trituberculatus]